ncbi:MAG: ACP S-malonyltransferase [Acidimicrobiia bacterium]|nr:ACP S-malonyltransferase [Acidimicrobiia bacterium]
MTYAILFPGQGIQHVGMGADLFEKHPELLGPVADEILGWSLRDVCLNGPEDVLTRTDHLQPALYALSFVLWEELAPHLTEPPVAAAGHSLGEYTALAAAGAFDFATGLRLVAARGRAMAEAAAGEPSGMVAVLGIDDDKAEEAAQRRRADGGRLWVANFNGPAQVVLAGGAHDLDWFTTHARDYGGRRVIPLKVAGAFHSPFMDSAVEPLAAALDEVEFAEPSIPVWTNLTAAPVDDHLTSLLQQLVAPVRFTQTLTGMGETGVRMFLHIGPGNVTATMAKRTVPESEVHHFSHVADVEEAADRVGSLIQ